MRPVSRAHLVIVRRNTVLPGFSAPSPQRLHRRPAKAPGSSKTCCIPCGHRRIAIPGSNPAGFSRLIYYPFSPGLVLGNKVSLVIISETLSKSLPTAAPPPPLGDGAGTGTPEAPGQFALPWAALLPAHRRRDWLGSRPCALSLAGRGRGRREGDLVRPLPLCGSFRLRWPLASVWRRPGRGRAR